MNCARVMQTSGRICSFILALAIGLFSTGLTIPSAHAQTDSLEGIVYVGSNIGDDNSNSILGFRRDEAGNLTPLSGSPFLTGGEGIFDLSLAVGPFDSDQNIIVNLQRTRLFAVNSGSNTIAVFDIRPDGLLVPVAGSPFPSGGINPVSLGLAGDILTVVNKSQDPEQPSAILPNYTTMRVLADGRLVPVVGSTVAVAAGSSPTQALISPSERLVFGADFQAGLLQSFVLGPSGRLGQRPPEALPASAFADPSVPRLPLGLQVHPIQRILYAGFVTINSVGVYKYDALGRLAFQRNVPNAGVAVCWLVTNKAGTYMYTTNTGDNTVSVYSLSDPLVPVEIQTLKLKGNGSPFQLALDSKEQFLYVVNQRAAEDTPLGEGNLLHVLKVNADGTVGEVPSSPLTLELPEGTRPQGVAAL
ncbi:MAG: lactonase family protein [Aphanocapsa lilacina HA4352-LM1]|nr:lactonase family protein [Aphanocapsa lilacina HA4352-LM1]